MALIFVCPFIDSLIHSTDFLTTHHILDMILMVTHEQKGKMACAVTCVYKFTASKVPLPVLHYKSEAWVCTQKLGGTQEQGTKGERSVDGDLVHHFMLATWKLCICYYSPTPALESPPLPPTFPSQCFTALLPPYGCIPLTSLLSL